MLRTIPSALLCWLFLLAQSHGQDVFVPRELKAVAVTHSDKEHAPQIEKAHLVNTLVTRFLKGKLNAIPPQLDPARFLKADGRKRRPLAAQAATRP